MADEPLIGVPIIDLTEDAILAPDTVVLGSDPALSADQIQMLQDAPIEAELISLSEPLELESEKTTEIEFDTMGFPIRGLSAYQVWLKTNPDKTEAEFLAAIVGPESPNADAAYASEIAASGYAEQAHQSYLDITVKQAAVADDAYDAACSALAAKASETAAALSELHSEQQADRAGTYANEASVYADRAETAFGLANAQANVALDAKNQSTASAIASAEHELGALAWSNQAGNYAQASETAKLQAQAFTDDASGFATATNIFRNQAEAFANDSEQWAVSSNTAKNLAETARSEAQTFRNEAATSATTAGSSVAQATTQAGLATTAKNQAGDFAASATNSASQSQSYADAAQVHANASYTSSLYSQASMEEAGGYAEAAADSLTAIGTAVYDAGVSAAASEISRLAAEAAQGDAEDAAFAANESVGEASGFASDAGTFASAAQGSALTALAGASATMPNTFDSTGKYFSSNDSYPATTNIPLDATRTMQSAVGEGFVYQIANNNQSITTKGRQPIGTEQKHRVQARQKLVTAGSGTNYQYLGWLLYDQADLYLGWWIPATWVLTVGMGWTQRSFTATSEEIKAGASYTGGADATKVTHLRPYVAALPGGVGGVQQTSMLSYQNVTSELAASGSASAANTSANSAFASKEAANISAGAANTSKLSAESFAGQAANTVVTGGNNPADAPLLWGANEWYIFNTTLTLQDAITNDPTHTNISSGKLFVTGGAIHLHPKKATPFDGAKRFQLRGSIQRTVNGTGTDATSQNEVRIYVDCFNASGVSIDTIALAGIVPTVASGVVNLSCTFGLAGSGADYSAPAGTAWIRQMIRIISNDGAGRTELLSFSMEDVESKLAAAGSAFAANNSASTANTRAGDANTSANAANTSKLQAEAYSTQGVNTILTGGGNPADAPLLWCFDNWAVFSPVNNLQQVIDSDPTNINIAGGRLFVTRGNSLHVHARKPTAFDGTKRFAIKASAIRTVNGTGNSEATGNDVRLYIVCFNAAGAELSTQDLAYLSPTVATGQFNFSRTIGPAGTGANYSVPASTAWVRPMLRIISTDGGKTEIALISIEDVESKLAAASSASAASTSEVNASTSASSAATSAVLSASFGSNSLNGNPTFADYRATSGVPHGWIDWAFGYIGTRQTGETSIYAYDVDTTGNTDVYGNYHDNGIQWLNVYCSAGWYVLEADFWLERGTTSGAGVLIWGASEGTAAQVLSFSADKDINNYTGIRNPGIHRFRKLIKINNSEAKNLYAMTNYNSSNASALGAKADKQIRWYRCSIRPASIGEINGSDALDLADDHTATLVTHGGVLSDLTGYAEANYSVGLTAGNIFGGFAVKVSNSSAAGTPVNEFNIRTGNFRIFPPSGTAGGLQILEYDTGTSTLYLQNLEVRTAVIKDAAVTSAKIEDLAVTNAKIGNAAITSAKIGDLEVGTIKIANAAVSDIDAFTASSTQYGSDGLEYSGGFAVFEETITLPYAATVVMFAQALFRDGGGNGDTYHRAYLRIEVDSTVIVDNPLSRNFATYMATGIGSIELAAGTYTFRLRLWTRNSDYFSYRNFVVLRTFK